MDLMVVVLGFSKGNRINSVCVCVCVCVGVCVCVCVETEREGGREGVVREREIDLF